MRALLQSSRCGLSQQAGSLGSPPTRILLDRGPTPYNLTTLITSLEAPSPNNSHAGGLGPQRMSWGGHDHSVRNGVQVLWNKIELVVADHGDCIQCPTRLFSLRPLISRNVTSASVIKTSRLGRLEAKVPPEASPTGAVCDGTLSARGAQGRRMLCPVWLWSADGCDVEHVQIRPHGLKPSGDRPCQPNVALIMAPAWACDAAKRLPLQDCH